MRIAALLVLFTASTVSADTVARHSFQSSLPAAGVARVVIDIPASEIVISNGGSRDVQLSGTAEREYHGLRDLDRAQRIANSSAIRMTMRGSSLVLSPVTAAGADSSSWRQRTSYTLQLKVPEGMPITLDQHFGEVEMTGVFGDTRVDMKAGEVRVRTPKRIIRELSARAHIGEVTTNLGERVISREGVFAGSTEYFNQKGRSSLVINLTAGEIDIVLTD